MNKFEIIRVTLGHPTAEGDFLIFRVKEKGGSKEYNGSLPTPVPGSTHEAMLKSVLSVAMKSISDAVGNTVRIDDVSDAGFYMLHMDREVSVHLKR